MGKIPRHCTLLSHELHLQKQPLADALSARSPAALTGFVFKDVANFLIVHEFCSKISQL